MKLKKSIKLYRLSKNKLAGPSTFSKSVDQFAFGISPFAIDHAKGAYAWDVDGNKYIDTIMSLGAVILGHADEEVNNSIKKQLKKGTSLSLTSKLEIEVAQMLCERIPCAEMVRFGKNGNDVTTAAIRLARHYTKRNHVLFCGYHGWQDWYICQTSMNSGIPKEISKYSHRFEYNNLFALEKLLKKYKNKVACIILEPVSRQEPICKNICNYCKKKDGCKGFLHGVKKLADKYNAVLIFDEIVTGFRFARGGYQEISGVLPDLACFSKAMANGLPISALVGKKEIMRKSKEIYYSLTFAGETTALAATKATLNLLDKRKAYEKIRKNGSFLINEMKKSIYENNLSKTLKLEGFPSRSILITSDHHFASAEEIKTYWIQECAKKGILTSGNNILSLAHNEKVIQKIVNIYSSIFEDIKFSLLKGNLTKKLKSPSVKKSAKEI